MDTLQFYTIGEDFTGLLNDFIYEGAFHKAYSILKDGGFNSLQIRDFFDGKYKFTGDTRKGDLNAVKIDGERTSEFWTTAICTLVNSHDVFWRYSYYLSNTSRCKTEGFRNDVEALLKVYTEKEIVQNVYRDILKRDNWEVFTEAPLERHNDGVLLEDGTFVACDYMGHNDLYEVLYGVGIVDTSNWIDDETTIHISSGSLNGGILNSLQSPEYYDEDGDTKVTVAQRKMLFDMRGQGYKYYGGFTEGRIIEDLMRCSVVENKNGSKYGNLMFLKSFYPNYNLPLFDKQPLADDIKQCIRTSPLKSLAGLLNSKFDINENSINEIKADWEKYKDLIPKNELHYFYQQYIEGGNGVSLYEDKSVFSYDMSSNRGDIVQGKEGLTILSPENYDRLRKLSSEIFEHVKKPVQLEFVVDESDTLYIVQLRLIQNFKKEKTVALATPRDAVYLGNSFTAGKVKCDADDVLIVDSEAESEALIGKKALLVRENPKFSHILALSASLGIPSMTGVRIDLLEKGEYYIDTQREEGYIQKIS